MLRELWATFIHTLMGAEADALCGAGYGERSTDRTNSRNGYRHRQFDTRTGSLDLAIPNLRHGSYFPDWLLERRKRAERPCWLAFWAVADRPRPVRSSARIGRECTQRTVSSMRIRRSVLPPVPVHTRPPRCSDEISRPPAASIFS